MDCIQLSLFGKTCPEHSAPTAEKISEPTVQGSGQRNRFAAMVLAGAEDAPLPERKAYAG